MKSSARLLRPSHCGFLFTAAILIVVSAQPSLWLDEERILAWHNVPVPGVATVESAGGPEGPWAPLHNRFTTHTTDQLQLELGGSNAVYRLRAVGVPPTPEGFTNLVHSFGILETIAGTGAGQDEVSYWQSWYEGWPGTWVTLSRPHVALSTLIVEHNGDIVVCDRGAHCVYRVQPNGTRAVIAGNGLASGGGDGFPALETGLNGVRSVWPVPTGGYLLLTHDGCQLWYLDAAGIVHLLLNGARGRTHSGDGWFFYTPEPKISEGRSVAMDDQGNILVCESDYGYLRRIRFLPVNH